MLCWKKFYSITRSLWKAKPMKNMLPASTQTKNLQFCLAWILDLTELLPAALGLKNGDAKIIKNAGGIIADPFGSVMRSLLIAVHTLGVEHILVIGHTDCGVQGLDSEAVMQKMRDNGISEESIEMMKYCRPDFDKWLCGFHKVENSVENSVNLIRKHPLIPDKVQVFGYVIDATTGQLNPVI